MAIKRKYNSNRTTDASKASKASKASAPPQAAPAPEPAPAAQDVDSIAMSALKVGAKYALNIGTTAGIETSREIFGETPTLIGAGLLTAAAIVIEVVAPDSGLAAVASPMGQASASAGLAVPITRKILHATGIAKPKGGELTPEEMRRQIKAYRAGEYEGEQRQQLPASEEHAGAEAFETVYQGAQRS